MSGYGALIFQLIKGVRLLWQKIRCAEQAAGIGLPSHSALVARFFNGTGGKYPEQAARRALAVGGNAFDAAGIANIGNFTACAACQAAQKHFVGGLGRGRDSAAVGTALHGGQRGAAHKAARFALGTHQGNVCKIQPIRKSNLLGRTHQAAGCLAGGNFAAIDTGGQLCRFALFREALRGQAAGDFFR